MNKDNQKTQNKVIVAISLTTGGALAGNWLRGVVDTSGMQLDLPIVAVGIGLIIYGLYVLAKV